MGTQKEFHSYLKTHNLILVIIYKMTDPARSRPPKTRQFTAMGIMTIALFMILFTVCVYATASKFNDDERARKDVNVERLGEIIDSMEDKLEKLKEQKDFLEKKLEDDKDLHSRNKRFASASCVTNPAEDCMLKIDATLRFKNKKGQQQEKTFSMDLKQPITKKALDSEDPPSSADVESHFYKSLQSWKQVKKMIKPNTKVNLDISIFSPFEDENQMINLNVMSKDKKKYGFVIAESIAREVDFVVVSNAEKLTALAAEGEKNDDESNSYEYDYEASETQIPSNSVTTSENENTAAQEDLEKFVGNIAEWGTDSVNKVWSGLPDFGLFSDEEELEDTSGYDYNEVAIGDSSNSKASNNDAEKEVEAMVDGLTEWGSDAADSIGDAASDALDFIGF